MTPIEARPRLVGAIGGILASVFITLIGYAVVRYALQLHATRYTVVGIVFLAISAGAIVGAIFPRIGRTALSYVLDVLSLFN
jgi:TctA family transporter